MTVCGGCAVCGVCVCSVWCVCVQCVVCAVCVCAQYVHGCVGVMHLCVGRIGNQEFITVIVIDVIVIVLH